MFVLLPLGVAAQTSSSNAAKAKELFTKVYDSVFGPQGSTLQYHVNIIGIYKTSGTIIYKGKKMRFEEERFSSWQDGTTAWMVDKKKKSIRIFRADDDSKDKYMSKFKYDVNTFEYSYKTEGDYYIVTVKIPDAPYFSIRWVEAKIRKSDYVPVSLGIKLAFMHTTVKISNFRSGGIADSNFVFPADRFKDYTIEDNR